MTSAFSWQNSISLCPASFCTPRPNLPWFSFLGVTQKTKIMASGPITLWQIDGKIVETVTLFWVTPKSRQMVTAAMKLKDTWKKSYDQPRQHIKEQRHYFVNKGQSSQNYDFSSGHVWMWELAYKESWVLKNWCFWTVVLEKTLESPLDCKEIQAVHSKGDQFWICIGRTDAKAETPILWPPDAKNWLIWKDPDAGKDWRQEEKGTTEDEMIGCHHRLWVWVNSVSWWWTREAWSAAVHGVAKSQTWLSEWTELKFRTLRKSKIASHYTQEKPVDCNSLDIGHSLLTLAGLDWHGEEVEKIAKKHGKKITEISLQNISIRIL